MEAKAEIKDIIDKSPPEKLQIIEQALQEFLSTDNNQ